MRYNHELSTRIVFATEHFRVFPSLGQLAEGHLLLVPVAHYCALADMPDERITQLQDLCDHIKTTLTRIYGPCLLFEHGIRMQGSGGCGIDHAHMHVVPVTVPGVQDVLTQAFDGRRLGCFSEIKTSIVSEASYLFFEDSLAQRFIFKVDCLPSQYMRTLVAKSIGRNGWDWRNSGRETELISTVQRLLPLLSSANTFPRG